MSITQIDFAASQALTKPVRALFDPDKEVPQGSALKYMRLQQITSEQSTLVAYLQGGAWFTRLVESQGITDTSYIFEPDDLLARVNEKLDAWKLNGLRITRTNSNQMRVDCVSAKNKKEKLANNILISTFSGDEAEFTDKLPDTSEYSLLATIPADIITDFYHALSLVESFSALRSDTQNRPLWLFVREGVLYLTATERASSQGVGMLRVLVGHLGGEEWQLGLSGRHLMRSTYITTPAYSDSEARGISILGSPDANQLLLEGEKGSVVLPVVEGYHCRALSIGSASLFFQENNIKLEFLGYRIFDLQELLSAIQVQAPKKTATRNDIVIEFDADKAVVSKRADSKRSEKSEILPSSIEAEGEWLPIVVDHSYISDALNTIKKFLIRQQKTEGTGEEFFSFEEDEPTNQQEEGLGKGLPIKLVQAKNVAKNTSYLLYIQPLHSEGCVVVLSVQTKERTQDFDDAD